MSVKSICVREDYMVEREQSVDRFCGHLIWILVARVTIVIGNQRSPYQLLQTLMKKTETLRKTL